ncbi:MAG: peptide ABC transporter substrate-binding protein [Rhodospirillaceae bacterium]|nr:peptide ABC transporter substrate-binding protein [Rhodospirillaceae bacterium]|tara:strand:+ start:2042 stop:3010 length:969 start_codon:yes stop_codon:yes gene_type:complete
MSNMLEVKDLTKIFVIAKDANLIAVNNVSFSLKRGETLGLVGESGSGKTTVGRCILRLIEPTEGRVVLDGQEITELDANQLRDLRANMQLVFQDPFGSLNPRLTVSQTIDEPLKLHGMKSDKRGERVREMMSLVGLDEHFYHYYPADLTASEQQRTGIARALATKPEFVVLDEPTSMLDPSARAEILDVLKKIQQELGTAYIFISHDLTSVAKISDRIAIMYLGHIVEHAPTEVIMESQRHPYSRALLSAVLFPDPARPPDPYVIEGEIPTAINPKPECPLYGRCPIREDACKEAVPPMVEIESDHFSACRRWRDVAANTQP